MGSVFRKAVTRSLPAGAELFTKAGEQFARWKPKKGRARTAKVVKGADGSPRIRTEAATFTAKFRNGSGIVQEVATGCRDEDAARSVLRDLERRAELVKSGVMTAGEDAIADQQAIPIADHFTAYIEHLKSKESSRSHISATWQRLNSLASDCGWKTLRDVTRLSVEKWLNQRVGNGASASVRNAYLSRAVAFCNWCVESSRLMLNPLARVPLSNEKADPRRQRRAMTEAELLRLLTVARWRPLAEYGRESDGVASKTNRKKLPLTYDGLANAVERAKDSLSGNQKLVEKLDTRGRERELTYKTLVLTGLRMGELASITVGQLDLKGSLPCLILNAADEKNGQGSTIPLRGDLAEDLKDWLASGGTPSTQGLSDTSRRLFDVPTGLLRILDRDLEAAGIAKRDDRGRTLDVHALRTTFGTLLSRGGVSPRTAQSAMRHSKLELTMGVYTDPRLLDVQGAMNSLPMLSLSSEVRACQADPETETNESMVAPTVAPTPDQKGLKQSRPVIKTVGADGTSGPRSDAETSNLPMKNPESLDGRPGEVECTWQNSNLRPHPCQKTLIRQPFSEKPCVSPHVIDICASLVKPYFESKTLRISPESRHFVENRP